MSMHGEDNGAINAVYIASLIYKQKEFLPLTETEEKHLQQWLLADAGNATLLQQLQQPQTLANEVQQLRQYPTQQAWQQLQAQLNLPGTQHQPARYYLKQLLAAAAVVLLLASAAWLLIKPKATDTAKPVLAYHNDVAPGGNKAILTLADGRHITLDSAGNGQLAQQGQVVITTQNGQLTYQATGKETTLIYNTVSTPRGGQYQLLLPDGSKVWMNAASSLRFPAAFTGKEREVELSGEAYFEIAQQASKPFIVKLNDTRVTVLGTQFNVMAYAEEEDSRTTLVEGLVKVDKAQQTLLIQPGQQARAGKTLRLQANADIEEALAWKNGRFQFGEQTSIQDIMRQIANWYDVEVVLHGNITSHIGGRESRSVTLAHLLKVLETTGVVRFSIEDRRVHVYPEG